MSNNLNGDKVADQVSLGSNGIAAHTVRPGVKRLHSDVNGVRVVVSREMLAGFYCCLLAANLLLMLMTLLSDLGFAFTKHFLAIQFDLKQEGNVAVWYSSTILLLTGAGALAISNNPPVTEPPWWFKYLWWMVALFFLVMSVDETAQLHEEVGVWFTRHFGSVGGLTEGSLPVFGWLLVFLPAMIVFLSLMAVVALSCFRFHSRSRNLLVGGVVCLVGAGIAEYVQAQMVRLSMD